MKLTIKFTKHGPLVVADKELSNLSLDEYYAMMQDAIQTLQTHSLGQYSIDGYSESNGSNFQETHHQ